MTRLGSIIQLLGVRARLGKPYNVDEYDESQRFSDADFSNFIFGANIFAFTAIL